MSRLGSAHRQNNWRKHYGSHGSCLSTCSHYTKAIGSDKASVKPTTTAKRDPPPPRVSREQNNMCTARISSVSSRVNSSDPAPTWQQGPAGICTLAKSPGNCQPKLLNRPRHSQYSLLLHTLLYLLFPHFPPEHTRTPILRCGVSKTFPTRYLTAGASRATNLSRQPGRLPSKVAGQTHTRAVEAHAGVHSDSAGDRGVQKAVGAGGKSAGAHHTVEQDQVLHAAGHGSWIIYEVLSKGGSGCLTLVFENEVEKTEKRYPCPCPRLCLSGLPHHSFPPIMDSRIDTVLVKRSKSLQEPFSSLQDLYAASSQGNLW